MSLSKRYLKSRPVSKVTFRLPREAAPKARRVNLVGEFNHWDPQATPMARLKSGEFKVTLDLETGREYHFRYLIEDSVWENDWSADRYATCTFSGTENSVVVV
jgi:1,4-alpha-glucan branching enzyme